MRGGGLFFFFPQNPPNRPPKWTRSKPCYWSEQPSRLGGKMELFGSMVGQGVRGSLGMMDLPGCPGSSFAGSSGALEVAVDFRALPLQLLGGGRAVRARTPGCCLLLIQCQPPRASVSPSSLMPPHTHGRAPPGGFPGLEVHLPGMGTLPRGHVASSHLLGGEVGDEVSNPQNPDIWDVHPHMEPRCPVYPSVPQSPSSLSQDTT